MALLGQLCAWLLLIAGGVVLITGLGALTFRLKDRERTRAWPKLRFWRQDEE